MRMIERLRVLSRPLKYETYFAGLLLVLVIAVGVGATAAVVVNWQSGRAPTDSTETRTSKSSSLGTTGPDVASEDTAIEPSRGSESPRDAANKAQFIHEVDRKTAVEITPISASPA
jgi:hypothetical protein